MTAIEEMWNKARVDNTHIEINGSLLTQSAYICTSCGQAAEMDHDSGCITCASCGNKACGDS